MINDGYYMINDGLYIYIYIILYIYYIYIYWLVVYQPTPLKNDGVSEWKSVGMIFSIPNCFWKEK